MGTQPSTSTFACNQSVVVGELVQLPEVRELASGTLLASFALTIRVQGQKTTSVPVSWFDPPERINRWKPGEVIVVLGSVVRRFYQAGGAIASRTDVNVSRAESLKRAKRFDKLLERHTASLGEVRNLLASP